MPHERLDIRNQFRLEIEDPEFPGDGDDSDSLYSNYEIDIFMDEAQKEFCRHVDVLPDNTSYKLILVAGQSFYDLDPRITRVRKGVLVSTNRPIETRTLLEMEQGYDRFDYGHQVVRDWHVATGIPQFLVTDVEYGKIQVVPQPVEADTIDLWTYRIPLKDLYENEDLEIPDQFRRTLLLKMKALAYGKHDTELLDEGRAMQYENQWLAKLDAINRDIKRKNRGPQSIAYGGVPVEGINRDPGDYRRRW